MAGGSLPRRLAVILYADVSGYSKLTGEAEDETHLRLSEYLDVIAEAVSTHRGQVMHYAGDAVLAVFDSATDSLACAVAMQTSLGARNAALPSERRVQFRVGINLGDVIEDRSDVYGDGVNIAARLEAMAPPGGICVSQGVRDAVGPNAPGRFLDLGHQRLKNISEPVRAFVLEYDGTPQTSRIGREDQAPVRFCAGVDGVSIAYTTVGHGPPLVIAGSWITHLEREWDDPTWGNYISRLAEHFRLLRYDQRGNGMSDWQGIEINFERMVDDLETVIDRFGDDQVAIWGSSQGAAVALAYAARQPSRVSRLIIYGGYARGRRRRGSAEAIAESKALATLIRQCWGRSNPAIRQTVTSMFMPDATAEEATWFNEYQAACGPAENMARFREVFDDIDITDLLDKVICPTLVVHCVGDAVAPLDEGKLIASRLGNAEFVTLESESHMMTERDAAFPRLIEAVCRFMAG